MDAINQSRPLPDQVYERIVDAICDGTLAAGERLTQDGLAGQLDVSRLPVGQALKRLEADGFVEPAGRRGVRVAPIEERFVRELYEFRAGIDQVTAGMAARRGGPDLRERGEAILARGRRAAQTQDMAELIAADMAFHQLLYTAAGNDMILDAMTSHWNHTRRVMQTVLDDDDHQPQVWQDHADILGAVCAGDADEAEYLARRHVERASAWFENEIARNGDGAGAGTAEG